MAQLRLDHEKFERINASIVVVGPEDAEAFEIYWKANDLPFIGLPDPDHRVLKLYGQEVKLFKMGRMPALLIVDRQGWVRYAHYGSSMQDIPQNAELFQVLDVIDEEESETHLRTF